MSTNWIDDYVAYNSTQESPPEFHKWCAISTIAAVLNRNVNLPRISEEGVTFYTLYPGQLAITLVAGAGRCRKSTAVNIAKSFLKDSGEVVLFDGKITPERLLSKLGQLKAGPVMTIVASELSTFLSKASYNDGMVETLIKLLDCESSPYETQKFTVTLVNPCVTLLLASTPFSIGQSISSAAHDTGFLSRQIFVYSDQPGAAQSLANNLSDIPDPVRLKSEQVRHSLIIRLKAMASLRGIYKWSNLGQMWFNRYYADFRASTLSEQDGYPQRRPDHLLRVAMCLVAARSANSLVIDECDLKDADRLLAEIESQMPRALAYLGRGVNSEKYDRILRVFKEKGVTNGVGHPVVDGADLYAKVIRYFNGLTELQSHLQALLDAGNIALVNQPGAKRQYVMLKELY
jgi:hypothetical protein